MSCPMCGKAAEMVCSGCAVSMYCSEACHDADWERYGCCIGCEMYSDHIGAPMFDKLKAKAKALFAKKQKASAPAAAAPVAPQRQVQFQLPQPQEQVVMMPGYAVPPGQAKKQGFLSRIKQRIVGKLSNPAIGAEFDAESCCLTAADFQAIEQCRRAAEQAFAAFELAYGSAP